MKKHYLLLTCIFLSVWISANAQATLNLTFFIEGYYRGANTSVIADTAIVELHDAGNTSNVAQSFAGMFQTNGTMACTFSNAVIGNPYYIVVRHRSSIETWSSVPLTMNTVTAYNFSVAQNAAYGSNQSNLGGGVFGFYSGDFNQDGNIDLFDYIIFDFGISHGLFGYYNSDINGDGNVDLLDYPILNANIISGIFIHRP